MKDNNNLLVGLLVVAIVVAVAGTWMNLQQIGGLTGAVVTLEQTVTAGAVSTGTYVGSPENQPPANPVELYSVIDCGIASDNVTASLPPGETAWCSGGNWSTSMKNLTLSVSTNSPKFNVNLSGTNNFVYSKSFAGYAIIMSGKSNDGEKLANGWNLTVNAGATNSYLVARNVTGRLTQNMSFIHGAGIYWNETQGAYTLTWTFTSTTCNATTC